VTIVDGQIKAITLRTEFDAGRNKTVVRGGSGFKGSAIVTIQAPNGAGTPAEAIAIMEDDYAEMRVTTLDPVTNAIVSLIITYPGSGYVTNNIPNVSIPAPTSTRPIVTASPYVQNCSNISGPWTDLPGPNGSFRVPETHPLPYDVEDVYPTLQTSRRIVDDSAGGIRVDGNCTHPQSPLRSFVVDAFTQVNQGGIGFLLMNRAYAQLVSTFGTFCKTHIKAVGGSFANCSNSVTDFGKEGIAAHGYWRDAFCKAKVVAPFRYDNNGDRISDQVISLGAGMFIQDVGYRSDVRNVSLDFQPGSGYGGNPPVTVEIDPPEEDSGATARVQGTSFAEIDRRVIVTLGSEAIGENGSLKELKLEFQGVGYKRTPEVKILGGNPENAATTKATLSLVSGLTVEVEEGRRPDFLSIARINGNWYTVNGVRDVLDVPSTYELSFFPSPPYADLGYIIDFHLVSYVSTGSHVMEYVGDSTRGTTYNALPEYGGIPNSGMEIVETAPARVFFSTSDHLGNVRVGKNFDVSQLTGRVTISTDSFNLSGLSAIGPFRRNEVEVGEQIREVSNDVGLISTTGTTDSQTVPTQFAVKSYVDGVSVPIPNNDQNGFFLKVDRSIPGNKKYIWDQSIVSIHGNVGIHKMEPMESLDVVGNVRILGNISVSSVSGNGAGLAALNASEITTGTLANARLPAAISVSSLTGNGSGLTDLTNEGLPSIISEKVLGESFFRYGQTGPKGPSPSPGTYPFPALGANVPIGFIALESVDDETLQLRMKGSDGNTRGIYLQLSQNYTV